MRISKRHKKALVLTSKPINYDIGNIPEDSIRVIKQKLDSIEIPLKLMRPTEFKKNCPHSKVCKLKNSSECKPVVCMQGEY